MTNDIHRTKWGNRFIITAIIQGGIMTSLALSMVASQFIFANNFDMIQFLSLSFEGPAKWFFLGIVFYLIFIVAIAVTAVFYIHLEVNLRRQISGMLNVLAWIHLIGMNIGGPLTTLLMIFAGLSGSGVLSVFTEGKNRSSECGCIEHINYSNSPFHRDIKPRCYLWWFSVHSNLYQSKNG